LDSGNLEMQADNLDAIIKPLRIMRTARVWWVLLLDTAAVLLGQGGMLCMTRHRRWLEFLILEDWFWRAVSFYLAEGLILFILYIS
jgi:hypothetical protein